MYLGLLRPGLVVNGVTYQQDAKGENLRIPPISVHIFWPISLFSAPLLISIFLMSDASQRWAFWELPRDTVQMTLESHELNCTDPLICRFFSQNMYYMIHSWLTMWIQNTRYGGQDCKLTCETVTAWGSPVLFKGQLHYTSSRYCALVGTVSSPFC